MEPEIILPEGLCMSLGLMRQWSTPFQKTVTTQSPSMIDSLGMAIHAKWLLRSCQNLMTLALMPSMSPHRSRT